MVVVVVVAVAVVATLTVIAAAGDGCLRCCRSSYCRCSSLLRPEKLFLIQASLANKT